jgi:hypothetical protein
MVEEETDGMSAKELRALEAADRRRQKEQNTPAWKRMHRANSQIYAKLCLQTAMAERVRDLLCDTDADEAGLLTKAVREAYRRASEGAYEEYVRSNNRVTAQYIRDRRKGSAR